MLVYQRVYFNILFFGVKNEMNVVQNDGFKTEDWFIGRTLKKKRHRWLAAHFLQDVHAPRVCWSFKPQIPHCVALVLESKRESFWILQIFKCSSLKSTSQLQEPSRMYENPQLPVNLGCQNIQFSRSFNPPMVCIPNVEVRAAWTSQAFLGFLYRIVGIEPLRWFPENSHDQSTKVY